MTLAAALAPVVAGLALWSYVRATTRGTLQSAVTEADQLDPGWRLWDLQRKRAEVPAEENSANAVVSALDLIPKDWLGVPTDPEARRAAEGARVPRGDRLARALQYANPDRPLALDTIAGLRAELAEVGPALVEARRLADLPRGRYKLTYGPLIYDTLLTHVQESRRVARLLELDAILRAEEGDIDGALASCRAILGVARSIGDEPFLISQLVRIAEGTMALQCLQQALSRGEASDSALAKVQALVADEAEQPLLLHGLRGERADYFEMLDRVAGGQISGPKVGAKLGVRGPWPSIDVPAFYRYNQGLGLRHLNRAVEIAKRPLSEQAALWVAWDKQVQPPQGLIPRVGGALAYSLLPAVNAAAAAFQRSTGMLRVAEATVAAERHRLARGRWPDRLDDLVPRPLRKTPEDPYTGGHVRLARREGELVIYVAGPDRKDDGGHLDPKFRPQPGNDYGLRLLDVDRRGHPEPASATK